jgi:K+/H+ antiporter YhaU regulatory subunit KhtT
MLALASLIAIVLISLLITRVATVALAASGLSREAARFKARSALSGVGFTTSESEAVVNHPVRRRIVMVLMLLGSAGVITVIGTLILSFGHADAHQGLNRTAVLLVALALLWLLARSRWVDARLSRLIARALDRWADIEVRDYSALLHLADRYAVMELAVEPGEWMAGKALRELDLRSEGVLILGIARAEGDYVAVPQFDTRIEAGDTLLAYGFEDRLRELDRRPTGEAGDRRHAEAVDALAPAG